ncbi:MAG TPA: hypothetical protein VHE30_08395 [Polyangiaceae bacterium]|nr:hypothetical protein [Polyangiaceae bacterium]
MVKRRHRKDERGAALFIVVLVIVLLTAIGVFAAHGASLAQAASGYSRRSAAAFYVGEFAMNVVTSQMAGKESENLQAAFTGQNDCRATAGVRALLGNPAAIVPCLSIDYAQVKALMNPALVSDTDGAVFGALSRPDAPAEQIIRGGFRVEMTDIGPAPALEGMAQNGTAAMTVWQSAFTVTARLVPTTAGGDCSLDATRASETQSLRGSVVFSTLGPPPAGALP